VVQRIERLRHIEQHRVQGARLALGCGLEKVEQEGLLVAAANGHAARLSPPDMDPRRPEAPVNDVRENAHQYAQL
jgi:hypothetical protein